MTKKNLAVSDIKPFIGANNFIVSKAFYVAIGWTLTYESENLCVLELAGHRFYLQNFYAKEWCENSMLHLAVEDVHSWHQHVQSVFADNEFEGGARFTDEIRDEGYADTFHVWDPSGVLIHFAQFKSN